MRLVFDRGTLLLMDVPSGAAAPEGLTWDPRVGSWRAPAWRHPELVNALARAPADSTDEVRAVTPPEDRWRPIDLRPYQDAALCAWELSGRRGMVVLPTGSGKTRLATAAMARTRLASLCLVPTRVLLEQWLREISSAYDHTVGCLGDGVHELAPVTVATYESAYRHMARIGNRFDLLVVDEAHHFGAGMRDEALEMAIAPARLGLTATPVRGGDAARRIQELIGPTVFELAIGDLAGSYLAGFDVLALHLDLTPSERAQYDAWMNTFRAVHTQFRRIAPEGSWEDFARAAARSDEGRRALEAWRQARKLLAYPAGKRAALRALLERHRDARVLVFTADNETAYRVAREHLIMPFTCDIGRKEREAALRMYRSGELKALVSARVLNEGLDVPDADVAVIVGGALGEREHVQRVGRLLRPRAGKRALVFELVSRRTTEVAQARRRGEGLAARGASPA
jgi:superfamily II DNA or RNA helicase